MSLTNPDIGDRVTLTNLRAGEVMPGRIESMNVTTGNLVVVTDDGRRWGPIRPPYDFLAREGAS